MNNMTIQESKEKLFWGYIMYVQKKGKEAAKKGLVLKKVIKFKDYLMDELNYSEEEAIQIQKEIIKDSINEN